MHKEELVSENYKERDSNNEIILDVEAKLER